ncbi:MAG: PilZ domain-containing protein [Phycisphaeraceae bacterium]|nr:PilZ domain-containing protein [Phycisphaeraceae bacterium]
MSAITESVAKPNPPTNPPAATNEAGAQRFLPVHIDSLDPQVLDMDLWLRHEGQPSPALYRGAGLEVRGDELERLKEQKIEYLYIPAHQHAIYRKALTRRLDRVYSDASKGKEERARIIRGNCQKMIEDVLLLPGQQEPVETISEISRTFQEWVSRDEKQFGYLLDMSSHDFYTSTHMVNVGVGCGLLVRALRPNDEAMFALAVQGGLLHDIGKRDIPPEILNKAGKLDPEEWETLRKHPAIGHAELAAFPTMPAAVLEMARDHHERLDGKGYPNGVFADQIGFLARVCAVVDVFDAITATRPYRGPTHPRDALRMMTDGVGTQFDREIFEAWRGLVERLIEEDASRTGEVVEGKVIKSLDEVTPQSPPGLTAAPATSDIGASAKIASLDNRRKFTRFIFQALAQARFVEQTRPHPVAKGQPFEVRIVDVSRGGVAAEAEWPFARGELLHLTIPAAGGRTLSRYARVVRTRSGRHGHWIMGLCFVDPPKT